jgi:hypothetical protein
MLQRKEVLGLQHMSSPVIARTGSTLIRSDLHREAGQAGRAGSGHLRDPRNSLSPIKSLDQGDWATSHNTTESAYSTSSTIRNQASKLPRADGHSKYHHVQPQQESMRVSR